MCFLGQGVPVLVEKALGAVGHLAGVVADAELVLDLCVYDIHTQIHTNTFTFVDACQCVCTCDKYVCVMCVCM